MSDFDRSATILDEPVRRRPSGSRFGDLGERIARTFGGFDRTRAELPSWEPGAEDEYPLPPETGRWEHAGPFPVVRYGYDCVTVDEHLAALEREVATLRESQVSAGAVAAEIDRIGQQTAAILRVAHVQAHEITRDAQAQAEKCVSDAAANAISITEEANKRLRELDSETDSVWQERTRLIDDARTVANQLQSLADQATRRFPPEAEKQNMVGAVGPDPDADQATVEVSADQTSGPDGGA